MSILNVVEHHGSPVRQGQAVPVRDVGENSQDIDFTAGEAQSVAFAAGTFEITICPDADCRVAVGLNPTATSTDRRVPNGAVITIRAASGQKISVIGE